MVKYVENIDGSLTAVEDKPKESFSQAKKYFEKGLMKDDPIGLNPDTYQSVKKYAGPILSPLIQAGATAGDLGLRGIMSLGYGASGAVGDVTGNERLGRELAAMFESGGGMLGSPGNALSAPYRTAATVGKTKASQAIKKFDEDQTGKISLGADKGTDILTQIKNAKSNQEKSRLRRSPEFLNLVQKTFDEMTVNGVPPFQKDVFAKLGMTNNNQITPLLKEPGFRDIPFVKDQSTIRSRTLYTDEAQAAAVETRKATNLKKAQTRANEKGQPVVYGDDRKTFLFPENNPKAKEDFLIGLEQAYNGKRGSGASGERFTLEKYAEELGINSKDFNTAVNQFKKNEGLVDNPRFNFDAPQTVSMSKAQKEAAIKQWLNNPNVLQSDKDLYKRAKETVRIYNQTFPDNPQNIDHIMAFVNSKNKIDAQTIKNLQITSREFNQVTKANLFEKPHKGFKKLADQIKNAKDKPTRQRLMKRMQVKWQQYLDTVDKAGYYTDTTGLPFLPKRMQVKRKGTLPFLEQIDDLQRQVDLAIDSSVRRGLGYSDVQGIKDGGRVGFKKGGLVKPENYVEIYPDGTKLYKINSFIRDIAKQVS